ncbi:MAG TPA: polyprenyl synthetase family protein, partial [Lacipirellulaceae bacterium]|nr:polyprenyl synthetase family protein [Lacipirellulaceae bacterium]
MARLLAPLAADMSEVERRLERELRHPDAFIDELAQHSFRLGGKRLRPALVLLTAQAVGDVLEEHRTLATVVEMIHTAT